MFDGTTMSSTGLTNGRHRHSGHEEVGNTCYEVTILRTPGIKTSVSRARLFISVLTDDRKGMLYVPGNVPELPTRRGAMIDVTPTSCRSRAYISRPLIRHRTLSHSTHQ